MSSVFNLEISAELFDEMLSAEKPNQCKATVGDEEKEYQVTAVVHPDGRLQIRLISSDEQKDINVSLRGIDE